MADRWSKIADVSCVASSLYTFTWGEHKHGECGHPFSSPDIVTPPSREATVTWKNVWSDICAQVSSSTELSAGNTDVSVVANDNCRDPRPVQALSGRSIKTVALGRFINSAIDRQGRGWVWGRIEKTTITPALLPCVRLLQVAAGEAHLLLLQDGGTAYSMGDNQYGQLGKSRRLKSTDTPVRINVVTERVRHISAGSDFSMLVLNDGCAVSFGRNDKGQLGRKHSITELDGADEECGDNDGEHSYCYCLTDKGDIGHRPSALLQVDVSASHGWKSIACGAHHCVGLDTEGKLYTWGDNSCSQLGHSPKMKSVSRPTVVQILQHLEMKAAAAGFVHSVALTVDGFVYTWGSGSHGQLGRGRGEITSIPRRTALPIDGGVSDKPPVVAVSAGGYCSMHLDASGAVWRYGEGCYQVGKEGFCPVQLLGPWRDIGEQCLSVSLGWRHGAVLAALPLGRIEDEMYDLYSKDILTDMTLLIDGQVALRCHRAVIASQSHSSSLLQMLEASSCVQLPLCPREAAQLCINWCYGQSVVIPPNLAEHVLTVARQLCLEPLVETCQCLIAAPTVAFRDPLPALDLVLASLLDTEAFADLTLCTPSGDEVRCHKCVLTARSDYFASMFSDAWMEDSCSVVDLHEDISLECLMSILRFLYGDFEWPNDAAARNQLALEVLEACHLYQVQGLFRLTETFLSQNMTVDLALMVANSLPAQNSSILTEATKRFMQQNKERMMRRAEWRLLPAEYTGEVVSQPSEDIPCSFWLWDLLTCCSGVDSTVVMYKSIEEPLDVKAMADDEQTLLKNSSDTII